MKVICYIRRTKEWAEQYKHTDIWEDNWKASQIGRIWDKVFTMSYIDFRRHLNEIQQDNLKEVPFDAIINQYEYVEDNTSIIVPTDDDDWFHPNVVSSLKRHAQPVMFWNFINYTEGSIKAYNTTQNQWPLVYETNNYAMIRPKDEKLLQDHTHADRTLRNSGVHINHSFSIHNRSLASLSLLKKRLLESSRPHNELLNMYNVCCQPIDTSAAPPYFLQHINKVINLYRNKLKVRKNCKLL